MSENNNDKITAKKTLTLKRSGSETNTVKQNFNHSRTKAVVVETKRRKIARPDEKTEMPQPITKPHVAPPRSKPRIEKPVLVTPTAQSNLSSTEMDARLRALEEAHIQDEIIRKQAAEKQIAERQAAEKQAKESEEGLHLQKTHKEKIQKSSSNTTKPTPLFSSTVSPIESIEAALTLKNTAASKRKADENDDDEKYNRRANLSKSEIRAPKIIKGTDERRRGKLTLNSALDEEGNSRGRSMAAMRRRQEKFKRAQNQEPREKISREVILPETITIQELAQRMAERSVDVIKFLMKQEQMMKPGDVIDADIAELIAIEFGHTVKRVSESDIEEGIFNVDDDPQKMKTRPPIVTIMGHVDHGKTSLLDAIRKANVVSSEAGGITQHIGAYQVEQNGQKITFIDTPGHAAFTAMRARGAQITDIAVLVVAADDSVMPQTIESINHAKAANVPIIVAINKIDKPTADAQKVRTELLQHEVFVETMGGETLEVEVSAKTGQNLDKLLEAILLQAEILDLKADSERTADGIVIEAKLDQGRGSVATVLVQKGTLHLSDIIVAGNEWGRIRALIDDHGNHIKTASPSTPVEILGMQGTPQAGDRFAVVAHEAKAREIAEYRQRLARDKAAARKTGSRSSLEQMMTKLQTVGVKEFSLIIKGDVQGSIEAITAALEKLGNEEVQTRIVHSGAGGITESDISLAETSNSVVIGFNVRANKQVRDLAETQGIEIRYYNIIYDLVDDIKAAMSGLLSPEKRETFLGNAEILEIFNITKIGKVAGCQVTEGKIERGAGVRLIRDNIVIHEGKLKTLKRFKDEVNEVQIGQECGIAFEKYEDMRAGDTIEIFRVEHVNRTL
ncbi:translation initiation factor IF-2 [Bartonella bacilliformis str. Heidi Mejia]|uniref:Translation initiation factor IF-2 n=2 Tax=Bartonella bacilliformis TaxID=774 RepID=IF2_BARBK|nr:translation initiation factor IF-2 [Bartonella bacilliformis]A1UU50.1 RecName: Full=Translation initiation factor IF-2 [Bartonella bacilliformis KC583]ABM45132.1 translation initiation factor IF-2 [Bartonella bacilliformis KC583]AMG86231.1 translation initiation factor IF-2 [Bartonella bacilliformis]EKS43137.1 translation initiation factor IF-2 [Bartonella bacilliformis INS]EYS88975.1 translation initiation factor IF-2 [Bartonella bacilliformis San Pedro600-02]EYS90936.1 translation initia